eukprot:TRINITY_DN15490_c0_g3_i1.p2 TRINITY_DN15490_c0_g3~~TRINITY_DN15490_c0_g3_i1.p2  ORF type:complete len:165 (+),score=42.97 TRINITY_DN15490_c0_g3_i1:1474-1968(+)
MNGEKQIYRALALIEREIGWPEMVKLINEMFMEGNNESLILKRRGKQSMKQLKRLELVARRHNAYKPPPQKSAVEELFFTESSETEDIKEIEEPREMPDSPKSPEEDKKQPQLSAAKQPLVTKRVCEKIDNAVLLLCDDLTAFYFWNSEEQEKNNAALYPSSNF